MTGSSNSECQYIINQLCTYIKNHAPAKEVDLLIQLAQRYFTPCPLEDLRERSIETLYHILISHWKCMAGRHAGDTKIRIFNPTVQRDGWQSTHTVIEISHDDIPFLVDSIRMAINRYGYQIHFIIHFGGLKVKRDHHEQIIEILANNTTDKDATTEAPIYIEIDRLGNERAMEDLKADIIRVLDDVRVAVADWRKMVARVESCLYELENNPPRTLEFEELAESRDFLRWLVNNNFTFLGARDYKLIGNGTSRALQVVVGSGLGVLRDDSTAPSAKSYAELPPQARKMALSKNVLIIAKTNTTSTVHRPAYTDYIGVKRYNEKGELIGERRFIGLYTSTAYHSSPRQIPFLRHKVDKVLHELGFPSDSHDGKEAVHILETLPRDDLFQASHEELLELTLAIIQLKERKRVRLLVRRDAFYRYFSCLVYVPREVFTTNLAVRMQEILMRSFQGIDCTFTTYFSDSVLARIHYLIRVNPNVPVNFALDPIEKKLIAAARSWLDDLKSELIERYGEADGLKYYYKYSRAFPTSYIEYYSARAAVDDIEKMENLNKDNPLTMSFTKLTNQQIGLKIICACRS